MKRRSFLGWCAAAVSSISLGGISLRRRPQLGDVVVCRMSAKHLRELLRLQGCVVDRPLFGLPSRTIQLIGGDWQLGESFITAKLLVGMRGTAHLAPIYSYTLGDFFRDTPEIVGWVPMCTLNRFEGIDFTYVTTLEAAD